MTAHNPPIPSPTRAPMMLAALLQDVSQAHVAHDVTIVDIVHDSRAVRPGSLFVALRGRTHDGHAHIPAAVARGAAAIVAEADVAPQPVPVVVVPDTRHALAYAARRCFGDPATQLQLVGITGTNGKTTTSHLVQSLWQAAGQKAGVIGTLGSHFAGGTCDVGLTTPDALQLMAQLRWMVDGGAEAVAIEVSSQALDQRRVAAVAFDGVAFLNLTHDHLDYHGTLEAYVEAKMRLLDATHAGSQVILNLDAAAFAQVPARARMRGLELVGFSQAWQSPPPQARVCLQAPVPVDVDGLILQVRIDGSPLTLRSPLCGHFHVENILCACSVGLALGLSPADLVAGVAQLSHVRGRLQRVSLAQTAMSVPGVFVDYAHTPDALEKALAALRPLTQGRLLCVVGCGGDRDATKRPVMGGIAQRMADVLVITNDNPRSESPASIAAAVAHGARAAGGTAVPEEAAAKTAVSAMANATGIYHVLLDRSQAIQTAIAAADAGDVVLIAGKGHETYQEQGGVRRPFDDAAEAYAALFAWHAQRLKG